MPYVDNDGISVHYDVEGDGPPLVLQHGSFGSLDDWGEMGYVAALRDSNRLILIDARGHGDSAKPHDAAAYSLRARASDVVAVLDDLGIRTADFMGYSMGGWIGFGLARYASERFRSLIIGGAHPYAEDMTAFRAMLPKTPDAFVSMVEPAFGPYLLPGMRERMVKNDLIALAALTTDREDLSAILSTMHMPCLLYVGTQDPRHPRVRECVDQLRNATFFTMEDCTHVAGFGRIDLVIPRVSAFLAASRS